MRTRRKESETPQFTPTVTTLETNAVVTGDGREPLVDARIRPLLERYVAAAGAALIDVGNGLVELQVPKADQKAFRDRAEIRIAFTLDALERDPEAEIAVVGSAFVEQLTSAIRARGSRASYGRIEPDRMPNAEAGALDLPITNGSVGLSTVDVARHRVVRLLARVVVRAGSAVEEHLLESGFLDAATGAAVPVEVADCCSRLMTNGRASHSDDNVDDAAETLAPARPSTELVSLALADLRRSLEPKVLQLRADAERALQAELHRIDGYYASLLADSAPRSVEGPDDTAGRLIEAEHARRRTEEERRHQVRAVVHPVQLTEWELLVQRARWELTDQNGRRAPLVSERWLNGTGQWVLACPQCGSSPKALAVCKSGHVSCDRCAQTCGVCADVFCTEHGIEACHVDGRPTCAEHVRTCGSCRKSYCTAHEVSCAEGAHPACTTCVAACAVCGRSVCDEHAMMSSGSSPHGARRLCGECLRHCEGGTNERVGVDEVTRCASCEKHVCEQHRSTCAVDQTVHCSRHLRRTDRSRRLVCEEHRAQCAFEPGSILGGDEVFNCTACGREACDRHSHVCVEDGQRYCEQDVAMLRNEPGTFACRTHHSICHVDQGAYRVGQTVECPVCGRSACKAHVRSCNWCGRAVCVRDLSAANGRCSTCMALRETDDPTDHLISAAAGLLGSRTAPKRWKVARDGGDTVVEVDLGWTRRLVFTVRHGDNVASGGRTHSVVRSRGIGR